MNLLVGDGIFGFQGEWRFLSNFYPALVEYEDWVYPTVEHAYQASKTNDLMDRALIRETQSPSKAKQLGKYIKIRSDWEAVKVSIMEDLLRQKFSKDPLRYLLLSTFDKYIEETNTWNDTFWGVCNGKGQNVLGNLLMKIRKELMPD